MKEKRKAYEKERSRDTEDIWLERQEQNQLEMKVNQADEKMLKNADVVLPPPAKSEMPIAEEGSTKKGDATWENGQILERKIYDELYFYLSKMNILPILQHGFQKICYYLTF